MYSLGLFIYLFYLPNVVISKLLISIVIYINVIIQVCDLIKDMSVYKRINITIHPIELEKLKRISRLNKETVSGMISRLIKDYHE